MSPKGNTRSMLKEWNGSSFNKEPQTAGLVTHTPAKIEYRFKEDYEARE